MILCSRFFKEGNYSQPESQKTSGSISVFICIRAPIFSCLSAKCVLANVSFTHGRCSCRLCFCCLTDANNKFENLIENYFEILWPLVHVICSKSSLSEAAWLSGQSWRFECGRPGFKSPTRTTEWICPQ